MTLNILLISDRCLISSFHHEFDAMFQFFLILVGMRERLVSPVLDDH